MVGVHSKSMEKTKTPYLGDILSPIMETVNYEETVCYLPETSAMDIKAFDSSDLSDMYWMDTRHCIMKRKRYNRNNLYSIFGEYVDLPPDEIKKMLISEIKSKPDWYSRAGMVCLGMRNTSFEKWLEKLQRP